MCIKHAVYAYAGRCTVCISLVPRRLLGTRLCLHARSPVITGEDMVAEYQLQLSFHQLVYNAVITAPPSYLIESYSQTIGLGTGHYLAQVSRRKAYQDAW